MRRSGFPRLRVALNEDGSHAQASRRLNVGQGIADDQAVFRRRFRKITERLAEQARLRLAAVALVDVVWAVIETIDVRAVCGKVLLQPLVESLHVGCRVVPERDAALIGDDEDAPPGAVQRRDRCFDAGEEMEIAPATHVFTLGWLPVQDAIAIEEDAANTME